MKISVLIPIKNRAHLLPATLDSILAQTLQAKEIIVINDNSKDNLIEAIEPYKEKIKLIKATNAGPGAARNQGLKIATGDYIQFFDSDDIMTNNKLEVQAELLRGSEADFVYSPFVKVKEVKNSEPKSQKKLSAFSFQPSTSWEQLDVIMNYYSLPKKHSMFNYVARGWCPITQASLFRRDFVEKIGGWREDVFTHEDLDFWFRVAYANPSMIHSNNCCVFYRQHGAQLTDEMTKKINYTKNHLAVLKDWSKLLNNEINNLSKIYFKAKQYSSKSFINQQKIENYSVDTSIKEYLSSLVFRGTNKIERFFTKSEWERMHGINKNPEQFQHYLSLL